MSQATSTQYYGTNNTCRYCKSKLRIFKVDHAKDEDRRPLFNKRTGMVGTLGSEPDRPEASYAQAIVCPVCDGPDLKGKSNPPKRWLEGKGDGKK